MASDNKPKLTMEELDALLEARKKFNDLVLQSIHHRQNPDTTVDDIETIDRDLKIALQTLNISLDFGLKIPPFDSPADETPNINIGYN